LNGQQKGQGAEPPCETSKANWIVRCVNEIIRKFEQYCAEKNLETTQDRATRRTAVATIWIAIFTATTFGVALFTYSVLHGQFEVMRDQLAEMQSAGKQSEKLIEANQDLARASKQQAEVAVTQAEAAAKLALSAAESAKIARDSLIAAQRAIIGPIGASITGQLKARNPIKATINYANTGRQVALTNTEILSKVFSIIEWKNGIASNDIIRFQQTCTKSELVEATALAIYPTSGFTSYSANVDSSSQNIPEQQRFTASEKLISGEEVFVINVCFVYKTFESTHHSASCFFNQANVTPSNNLTFCSVGQGAD
jgi:hypothetical protein